MSVVWLSQFSAAAAAVVRCWQRKLLENEEEKFVQLFFYALCGIIQMA